MSKVASIHDAGASRIGHEVQHLFESRSIEDIRKIESLTRKEVEDKRQELRKLIGARYRDLISSADSIVTMKQQADLLFSRLEHLRANFINNNNNNNNNNYNMGQGSSMSTNTSTSTDTNTSTNTRTSTRTSKYHTASLIASMLSTPEHIWTALERSKHLEATLLYHQAQLLHAHLAVDPEARVAMEAMPIAPRQWTVVCQFPPLINSASKEFLADPDHSPEQYASTLCAVAILEKPAPSQIFSSFLAARSQLLERISREPIQSHDKGAIVERLCNCVYAVTSTFFLIFYMFVCPTSQPNPKNPKLLAPSIGHKDTAHRQTKHVHLATHLHATTPPTPPYFYSILRTIKDDIDAIYKTHDLDHTENSDSTAFFSLHIPSSSIHTQCEQWLSGSAQRLQSLASELLSHITGAQVLAQVRDCVREGLDEVTSVTEISWGNVCQLVIGREVDLWEVLCVDTFAARAREIVAHSFQTVDFNGALSVLLKTPSAGVGLGLWSAETTRDEKETVVIQNKAAGLTPNVNQFVRRFDTMLATCLADLAHLTQQPQPTPPPSPSPPLSRPQPSPRIPPSPSPIKVTHQTTQTVSAALEAYVQDRCFAGVASFLGEVRKRLEVLQASILTTTTDSIVPQSISPLTSAAPLGEGELRNYVDEALLIAQAARALSSYSKQLSAALVPTNTIPPTTPTLRKTKNQSTADKQDDTANSRLAIIKTTLRQCYLHGYVLWAKWVTVTHVQWLAACVRRDSWNDGMRKQGWEEHKVTIDGEDNTPVEEKLYLPFQPSPYVLEFLFAVCREIHRAGGHTIHRTALEYLARELAQAVLELYDEVARTYQGATSKEGGVQLLCDACFLIDVLSVPDAALFADEDLRVILASLPGPVGGDAMAVGSSVTEIASKGTEGRLELAMAWGRRVDATISTLKDLLDPIDLAFYEPHVKTFVVRCYQRCSVMFGALVQLHRAQDSMHVVVKVPAITEPNIIPLAKATARFGYLPTSVPVPTTSMAGVGGVRTPSKLAATSSSSGGGDGKEAAGKRLSFMEQGVGSLKKFTSLNMLSSPFASPTSPQPPHTSSSSSSSSGLSTTPPKSGGSLWSLLG